MPALDQYQDIAINFILVYGLRLIIAILILLIGLWAINKFTAFVFRLMERRNVDESLRPFLKNILGIALRILLLVVVVAQLGLEMTSFIAVLGSAGLAVGLALQGSLSNLAGGVLILTIKPFRVGDFIEAQGQRGTVQLINIFNTVLKTAENKTVYMPNGPLASTVVVNYSVEPTRRVELVYTVSVNNAIGKVRQLILQTVQADARVLPDPAPVLVVTSFTDTLITLTAQVWCKRQDAGNLVWDLNEQVKAAFEANNIAISVPK
ncbi:mechanosensitive ion channel family protein [Pontibacter arcticus]|uniref:Mechanosensitive ion channel family protein n=1 Tax=Pontibacter arcticus TaxID=2080288 RepID=A0A364RBH0_9BACT|nr:mechanosensitive ion channel domain-containing protein [Pontibacter arcticus]RAU81639.1 mechanosensitive ion channel family protein [Pontibacter arcticus]